MGLVLIGVLAGILIGLGFIDPSHGYFLDCRWQGCADGLAVYPIDPKPVALGQGLDKPKLKIATAAKSAERRSAKSRRRVARIKAAHVPTKSSTSQADRRFAEMPDPILLKARAAVAAKLENPSSAEFADMDRAFRKNMFGHAVDTICGHVREKNASGGDAGVRPFLYLVKEDEAYVVDGKPGSAAATAYRNICN